MKKRVFIAINLPEEVKEKIANFVVNLEKKLPQKGVKFVTKENLHITLHFLGDQTEQKINEIEKISESIAQKFSGFEIVINKLDTFPNMNFPRIVVLGADENNKTLEELRNQLGEGLESIGVETDKRPWKGHITLARIKFGSIDFSRFKKLEISELRWVAYNFDLIESTLTSEGPTYKILKSFKL